MIACHYFWKISTMVLERFFQKLGSSLLGSSCTSQTKVRMNHLGKHSSCNGLPAPGEWKRVHGLALKHKALNIPSASRTRWDDLPGVTNVRYDCRHFKSQWQMDHGLAAVVLKGLLIHLKTTSRSDLVTDRII